MDFETQVKLISEKNITRRLFSSLYYDAENFMNQCIDEIYDSIMDWQKNNFKFPEGLNIKKPSESYEGKLIADTLIGYEKAIPILLILVNPEQNNYNVYADKILSKRNYEKVCEITQPFFNSSLFVDIEELPMGIKNFLERKLSPKKDNTFLTPLNEKLKETILSKSQGEKTSREIVYRLLLTHEKEIFDYLFLKNNPLMQEPVLKQYMQAHLIKKTNEIIHILNYYSRRVNEEMKIVKKLLDQLTASNKDI